jgi:cold shock protein
VISPDRLTGLDETARVREWHVEEGWGVLDSEETPGGCFFFWSHLHMKDDRELQPGQQVRLEWESVTDQDGHTFRAAEGYTFHATHVSLTGLDETARVRKWSEKGWGVLDSEQTPGGCWVHYSDVHMKGDRELQPGQQVRLEWESVTNQDGYSFRATHVSVGPYPPSSGHIWGT